MPIQDFEADFLWKVSLKILNLGIILKTFNHEKNTMQIKCVSQTICPQTVCKSQYSYIELFIFKIRSKVNDIYSSIFENHMWNTKALGPVVKELWQILKFVALTHTHAKIKMP